MTPYLRSLEKIINHARAVTSGIDAATPLDEDANRMPDDVVAAWDVVARDAVVFYYLSAMIRTDAQKMSEVLTTAREAVAVAQDAAVIGALRAVALGGVGVWEDGLRKGLALAVPPAVTRALAQRALHSAGVPKRDDGSPEGCGVRPAPPDSDDGLASTFGRRR